MVSILSSRPTKSEIKKSISVIDINHMPVHIHYQLAGIYQGNEQWKITQIK